MLFRNPYGLSIRPVLFSSRSSLADEAAAWRFTLQLGAFTYGALILLAAIFYLERMTLLDMAFQGFHILRTGELQIQSGRFGAAATQVFPWAAQALGLSLKGVLLTYSLGHILYAAVLFAIVLLCFKQWRWGLILLLVNTLMTTHTFYWLSEMPQGLTFLAALLAWTHARETPRSFSLWEYPLVVGAVITAFYFHPLVLHAFTFCAAYFWFDAAASRVRKRNYALLAVLFAACFTVKYFILPLDWYDNMALERSRAFAELWPDWLHLKSQRDFLQWLATDYYVLLIVFVFNIAFLMWYQRWALALLSALGPVVFVFMVNVPHHYGAPQFYMENLYLPLGIMVAVPWVFSVLPSLLPTHRLWIPVSAVVVAGLLRIALAHSTWTTRMDWERHFLRQTSRVGHRKWIVAENQVPMDTLILSWGSAFEFLMLSSLEHPDSARCLVIDEDPQRFDSLRTRPRLFLSEFKNYPFDDLPARYFRPQDTTEYRYWSQ
ncbi:MAG: hypothetical protein NZM43_05415 [Saprospiraceae bacterium]|nr:hypothetical protein [Saprospiraceae bacterium]MDW8483746.1 hypothetical protein [Saprospiraceae bacterium]